MISYTFVDLFAGAGGFGLGFQMSGRFTPICSVEKDLWAVETLRANNHHTIIHADITKISTRSSVKKQCKEVPDVIIGGPPCQGFSIAGKGDPSDPRNALFRYFVKWVKYLSPKVFVMENVTGLLMRKNLEGKNVIDIIKEAFCSVGYSCQIWVLNAADYGVPQMRQRIFIIGNRLGKAIPQPKPTHSMDKGSNLPPYITSWEALSDLPQIAAKEGCEYMKYDKNATNEYQCYCRMGSAGVYNHVAMKHTKRLINRFQKILDGGSVSSLPDELKVKKRNGNGVLSETLYTSNYRHIDPDTVSFTIPASFYSTFIHPFMPRNITAREAARLQSFPDRYIFKGKRTQISSKLLAKLGKEEENHLSQYNQIGNAVPPKLAKVIAESIAKYLDERNV
jgi:DNA (cytosine-5)-methyltransferase 1